MTRRAPRVLLAAAGLAVSSVWLVAGGATRSPTAFRPSHEPRLTVPWPILSADAERIRAAALSQADVWRPADPSTFDFGGNPPDRTGELTQPIVPCQLLPKPATGTTPKFDCVFAGGETVKVKYGHDAEIHAEAAATALLRMLGYGADIITLIPRLRCYGCPRHPFVAAYLRQNLHMPFVAESVPGGFTDFEWVAVERARKLIERGEVYDGLSLTALLWALAFEAI